jgi:hypothetical protein
VEVFVFHVGGSYRGIACIPPPGVTVISNN